MPEPTEVFIDPQDVTTFYFRPEPGDTNGELPDNLGPVQVSIDDGETWEVLELGADPDGVPAYVWTVAGPAAQDLPTGVHHQVAAGRTDGLKRVVDNPERTTRTFRVYAMR